MKLLVLFAVAAGCSAPALPPDLARAESHERAGHHDAALAAYAEAAVSCQQLRPPRRRKALCAAAHLQRAELLETMGERERAAAAYESIPGDLPDDPTASATALYRAGRLRLALGEAERGWELLWRTITHFPDQPHAGDALNEILQDGRGRDARELYGVLGQLRPHLADTRVGDNLLYAMADLAEHELGAPERALAHLDQLVSAYPGKSDSGLYDDALWHGARLARELGNPRGAVRRYRQLLDTREVSALGIGSYLSVWLDDAQLELGRVLREDLGEHPAALAAFERLPEHYPDSILRDDAQFEAAVTLARMDRPGRACAALAELAERWPDSKYELSRAPKLREELGCQP